MEPNTDAFFGRGLRHCQRCLTRVIIIVKQEMHLVKLQKKIKKLGEINTFTFNLGL